VSVAVKKIEGVQSVNVSLNQGMAKIQLRPGNNLRIEQVQQAVTNNGFTPKEAKIVVDGTFVSGEGKVRFQVAGTNQTFTIIAGPGFGDLNEGTLKSVAKKITVEAVMAFEKNKIPDALTLTAIRQ